MAHAILAHASRLTNRNESDGTEKDNGEDPLPRLRMALSRQVAGHCSAEIDLLNDRLRQQPQIAVEHAYLVRRYHDELLARRGSLMECNANWSTRRITDNPGGFLASFKPLADALIERVRWEEQEFYPKVFGRAVSSS